LRFPVSHYHGLLQEKLPRLTVPKPTPEIRNESGIISDSENGFSLTSFFEIVKLVTCFCLAASMPSRKISKRIQEKRNESEAYRR